MEKGFLKPPPTPKSNVLTFPDARAAWQKRRGWCASLPACWSPVTISFGAGLAVWECDPLSLSFCLAQWRAAACSSSLPWPCCSRPSRSTFAVKETKKYIYVCRQIHYITVCHQIHYITVCPQIHYISEVFDSSPLLSSGFLSFFSIFLVSCTIPYEWCNNTLPHTLHEHNGATLLWKVLHKDKAIEPYFENECNFCI